MRCRRDGCDQDEWVTGLCSSHYYKARRERRRVPKPTLRCEVCGREFQPVRYEKGRTRFCSARCKGRARTADGRGAVAARKSYLMRRYELTPDQVAEMEVGGCQICGTTDWPGRHNRPHIDHDHATGAIRGILCSECNTALGKLKDDVELVRAAVRYLTR